MHEHDLKSYPRASFFFIDFINAVCVISVTHRLSLRVFVFFFTKTRKITNNFLSFLLKRRITHTLV